MKKLLILVILLFTCFKAKADNYLSFKTGISFSKELINSFVEYENNGYFGVSYLKNSLEYSAFLLNSKNNVTPTLLLDYTINNFNIGLNISQPIITSSVLTNQSKNVGVGFQIGIRKNIKDDLFLDIKYFKLNSSGTGKENNEVKPYNFSQDFIIIGFSLLL